MVIILLQVRLCMFLTFVVEQFCCSVENDSLILRRLLCCLLQMYNKTHCIEDPQKREGSRLNVNCKIEIGSYGIRIWHPYHWLLKFVAD